MVVRGGGEMGSAAAALLFRCGFPVIVLERPEPLAVRRLVSFAEAVRAGSARVEEVLGRRVSEAAASLWDVRDDVAVVVDATGASMAVLRPEVLVEARMAKKPLDASPDAAPLVIGLGPGLVAGSHVHAVVETQRGPDLGRVVWSGAAAPDSAVPGAVLGVDVDRVLRAPAAGVFTGRAQIGDLVAAGDEVGQVAGLGVRSATSGLLRGLLADGVAVEAGTKVGDVDPRGAAVRADRLSDKGRAVAAGVLEAILVHARR